MQKAFPLLVVSLVLMGSFAWAQNLDPQPFKFSWKPTEGAGGYLAEIQDLAGNAVTSQQVSGSLTAITFKLVPGSYQLRMTTLNRLLKPESATEWVPFHVPAPGPPAVGTVSPILVEPGNSASLDVPISGLAQDATAAVTTPTGATVTLPRGEVSGGVLRLTLPLLTERGNYSILLTNPPKLTTTISGKLSVHYSIPAVAGIVPAVLPQSEVAQIFHVRGQNFSDEAIVVLQPNDGRQIPLTVRERSGTDLTVVVPPGVATGGYELLVANAPDEVPVTAEQSLTIAVVEAKPKFGAIVTLKGNLTINAITGGMVTVLGQTVAVPEGSTLPINEVDAGEVPISMTYADGHSEQKTVTVKANATTTVPFEEKIVVKVQHKKLHLTGSEDDFAGVSPFFTAAKAAPGQISGGSVCRDDEYLYIKIDFAAGKHNLPINNSIGLNLRQEQKIYGLKQNSRRGVPERADIRDWTDKWFSNDSFGDFWDRPTFVELRFKVDLLDAPRLLKFGLDYDLSKPIEASFFVASNGKMLSETARFPIVFKE